LPHQRRDLDGRHVFHQDRSVIGRGPDHGVLDVGDVRQQRLPANEPLLALVHDIAAARVRVVLRDGVDHLVQRHAFPGQPIRVDANLERLVEAAVRIDLGDARNLPQARRDFPFQQRPQFHRRVVAAPHFELQYLAERRRQHAQFRRTVSLDPVAGLGQPFTNQLPGPHDVGALAEHDRHQR